MRQEEAKRRRRSSAEGASRKRPRHIEEISLIDDDDDDNSIAATLQKQREEQVRAQTQAGVKMLKLSNLSCTVCLDTPKDLTATSCGELILACGAMVRAHVPDVRSHLLPGLPVRLARRRSVASATDMSNVPQDDIQIQEQAGHDTAGD